MKEEVAMARRPLTRRIPTYGGIRPALRGSERVLPFPRGPAVNVEPWEQPAKVLRASGRRQPIELSEEGEPADGPLSDAEVAALLRVVDEKSQ
jgi:hypothetical protein